jgi:hypothetical protein
MTVVNYEGFGGDWAQRMKAQARLVPASGAGLSYFRNWAKAETGVLVVNRRHSKTFTLLTGNVRPDATWKVQLKLVWDRPVRRDVVKELTQPFNASCLGGVSMGS